MRRLALTCALFLTACGGPRVELAAPYVPADLLRPVVVRCPNGDTAATLGRCAIMLRMGLSEANSQIAAIAQIVASEN
jgi:hypothetical protein